MTAEPSGGARWTPAWELDDRLRKIRRHLGMSQVDFAERIGQNPKNYATWEAGKARPRDLVAVAKRIELAIGVPASWVLGIDEPGPRGEVDTGDLTRRYPTGNRRSRRHLVLVSSLPRTNRGVSARYGSSLDSSRLVNHADTA